MVRKRRRKVEALLLRYEARSEDGHKAGHEAGYGAGREAVPDAEPPAAPVFAPVRERRKRVSVESSVSSGFRWACG